MTRDLLVCILARRSLRDDAAYLLDGEPVELAESYVLLDLAAGTAIEQRDAGTGGIYARLEESGHILAEFVEEISARMPTLEERLRLELPSGTPVIPLTRVLRTPPGVLSKRKTRSRPPDGTSLSTDSLLSRRHPHGCNVGAVVRGTPALCG